MSTTGDQPHFDNAEASDEQLVQRYAAGELEAFDALYARHELPVWRYVLRILRAPSLADTLLKDIWFSVLRQIAGPAAGVREPLRGTAANLEDGADDGNFGGADPADHGMAGHAGWRFKPWLFAQAHSRIVEYMRSSKTPIDAAGPRAWHQISSGERNAGRLSIKPPDPTTRAGRAVAGFRQLRSLKEAQTLLVAVEHLPFAQRYAFLMHAEGQLRAGDIARATSVSFATAISRLRFAREALRLSLSSST